MKYTIEGTLRLNSPLHVARPGKWSVDMETGRISQAGASGRTQPLVRTAMMPVALPAASQPVQENEEGSGEGEQGGKKNRPLNALERDIPVYPANGLGGRLRRLCFDIVNDALVAKGEKISLPAYRGCRCGAVTGQITVGLTFDYVQQARAHPFVGLFGGGPRMVPASLVVSSMWPVLETTIAAGVVPDVYAGHIPCAQALESKICQVVFTKRQDPVLSFDDPRAMNVVDAYEAAVMEWMDSVLDNKAERKAKRDAVKSAQTAEERIEAANAKKEVKKSELDSVSFIEVVVPGVYFYLRSDVDTSQTNQASLGLLILGFAEFANSQGLGGKVNRGCGRFDTSLHLRSADGERAPLLKTVGPGLYEPNRDSPMISSAIDAWETYAKNIEGSVLETLMQI